MAVVTQITRVTEIRTMSREDAAEAVVEGAEVTAEDPDMSTVSPVAMARKETREIQEKTVAATNPMTPAEDAGVDVVVTAAVAEVAIAAVGAIAVDADVEDSEDAAASAEAVEVAVAGVVAAEDKAWAKRRARAVHKMRSSVLQSGHHCFVFISYHCFLLI